MSERRATVERKTKETEILLHVNLDGTGEYDIDLPIFFLKHMLELFSKHALIDLRLRARGDVEVDAHHLVEDVGICLGCALAEAWGDKTGITRFGDCCLPMDEALVLCAIDLSGRSYLQLDLPCEPGKVGDFDVELAQDFFYALVSNARINLHLRLLAGENRHHILEAAFKSFARALREAIAIDESRSDIPSTKGTL